jgi:hypothetical protein
MVVAKKRLYTLFEAINANWFRHSLAVLTRDKAHLYIKGERIRLVLTRRSGGSKLEREDSPQKGKGPCKRSNEPLRENLSKKRSNWCDRATNRRRKLHAILELLTAHCTIGASICRTGRVDISRQRTPNSARRGNTSFKTRKRLAATGARYTKKSYRHLFAHPDMRFAFIAEHRQQYRITLLCKAFDVSVSGYYA